MESGTDERPIREKRAEFLELQDRERMLQKKKKKEENQKQSMKTTKKGFKGKIHNRGILNRVKKRGAKWETQAWCLAKLERKKVIAGYKGGTSRD